MSFKTLQIILIIVLLMVAFDLVYIYAQNGTFNVLYAAATLVLFAVAWDSLRKLKSHHQQN